MDRDELEFLISQHFDGTLDEGALATLESRIATDAEARAIFNDYAKIDVALRKSRSSLAIDPACLQGQIFDAIDAGNAKPMRISRPLWIAPLLMAACLIIGLTLGVIFLRDDGERQGLAQTPPKGNPTAVTVIALNNGNEAPPAVAGYASVSVGVPANLTPQIVSALYLSRDLGENKVSIRAAGKRPVDAFD